MLVLDFQSQNKNIYPFLSYFVNFINFGLASGSHSVFDLEGS